MAKKMKKAPRPKARKSAVRKPIKKTAVKKAAKKTAAKRPAKKKAVNRIAPKKAASKAKRSGSGLGKLAAVGIAGAAVGAAYGATRRVNGSDEE